MAWLYVPVLADLNSDCGASGPISAPCAGASGTDTPPASLCRECRKAPWTRLLSGMTSQHSTAARGVASWISSLQAIHASRSPLPDGGEGQTIPDTSGPTSPGSFARWDPASSSWKTWRGMFDSDFPRFSESWPRWGSMRSGAASARPRSAHRTRGSACSCWPTVAARDFRDGRASAETMAKNSRPLNEVATHWPTARSEDSENCGGHRGATDSLTAASRQWPRPRDSDTNGAGSHGDGGLDLRTVAGSWATPTASPNSNRKTKVAPSEAAGRHGQVLAGQACSHQAPATPMPGQPSSPPHQNSPLRLNPLFVEWLMGFPRGWSLPSVVTACAASETQLCQPKPSMQCAAC